jgi:hypothetical protein
MTTVMPELTLSPRKGSMNSATGVENSRLQISYRAHRLELIECRIEGYDCFLNQFVAIPSRLLLPASYLFWLKAGLHLPPLASTVHDHRLGKKFYDVTFLSYMSHQRDSIVMYIMFSDDH